MKVLVSALALSAVLVVPAAAQVAAGTPYEQARAALLAKGWKPDTGYGTKTAVGGRPVYHYPEIMCGPAICRAKWHDSRGQPQAIMLDRGINRDHTVSASQ